jgi:hypothetical protein
MRSGIEFQLANSLHGKGFYFTWALELQSLERPFIHQKRTQYPDNNSLTQSEEMRN